ncbi:DNA polymerase I [Salinibius halmophilus]|uniref:DNA polymerase I n=1 Tax=Salinibius halmophilus TaxID=1853216 RepID=UPI000E66A434|nr:DNA polymerase I [Salinibius halmophilus]
MAEKPPVILIDGSSYLFRAFHAMPPLTTRTGQPTGAIRGVINMIRSMIDQYPNSEVVVVFDAKGPTFRNDMYSEYKANRPPMPDELRVQIEPIHNIIHALGLPLLCIEGVEADDVIGTLAYEATATGQDVIISTGDKDMAQLVSPHVSLINTMKDELLDVAGVTEKYGFGPELMIDYLALMGDKVDNIPGVPGVGEKTAKALIEGIGGINDIYQRLDDIADLSFRGAKSMAKKLIEHEAQARLSYELATIKCDCELQFKLNELVKKPADRELLVQLYSDLEFKGWLSALQSGAPELGGKPVAAETIANAVEQQEEATDSAEKPEARLTHPENCQYQLLENQSELETMLGEAKEQGRVGLFIEFDGQHYMQAQPAVICIATQPGKAYVIHCHHFADIKQALQPLWQDFNIEVVCHNLKPILHWLSDSKVTRMKDDVMLMSQTLESTLSRDKALDKHFDQHGIDNLSRKRLNTPAKSIVDIAGKFGKKQLKLSELPANESLDYLAERADMVLRLFYQLRFELQRTGQYMVYQDIEMRLLPILVQVERNGTLVDADYLHELSAQMKVKAEQIEARAHDLAGQSFNLDSPKQLGEVLFEKLQLPAIKKTATGKASTNEEVLSQLAEEYEIAQLILDYRRLRKLISTYADPLPLLINSETGRVHTNYHQIGAATGRFSSTEPNLQNIPIRHEEGKAIRRAFVARPGWVVLAADYSQIELRIMTHLSQDPALIDAFSNNRDIHRATAAEVMGVSEEEVTDDMRRSAKAINFGLIYGMSAHGLARQLGISRSEASKYVNTYFERYPGVKQFMERTRAEASEKGYVETVYGRRLYLPGIKTGVPAVKAAAQRTAINAPMQGTAADIIKKAMTDVQIWLRSSKLRAQMVMQVHDELVFEVHPEDAEQLAKQVKLRMQHAASLSVPLDVGIDQGDNWQAAH